MTFAEAKVLYEKQPERTRRSLDLQFATIEMPSAAERKVKETMPEIWTAMIERTCR
jgi:hypothetical protein